MNDANFNNAWVVQAIFDGVTRLRPSPIDRSRRRDGEDRWDEAAGLSLDVVA